MRKKSKRIMLTSIVLLVVTLGIYYKNFASPSETTAADISISDADLPEPVTVIDQSSEDPIESIDTTLKTFSKPYMLIPVANVSQLPELPTGCEITSLTTVLNYLGYDVDKEYMAENYLDKLSDLDGSFFDYFIGSPWDDSGWGCFAPAITTSANNYLTDCDSPYRASNISNSSVKSLLREVAAGNPVIVWVSTSFSSRTVYSDITLNDSSIFAWPNNEHCVVLIGYNLDENTVTISDPMYGIVEHDIKEFIARYREFYKQAVFIK